MTVAFSDAGSSMSDVTETLERQGVEIRSLSAEVEGGHSRYTIQVRIPPGRSVHTRHSRRYPRFRTSSR